VVVGPAGGLQQKSGIVWFQLIPVFQFSLRSTEVDMLERAITCLRRGAVALVLSEAVICCPGFPRYFPESCPWELNLGAVLICPGLSVVSYVGRALLRLCPLEEVVACCGCMVLSLSLCYMSTACPIRC